MKASRWPHPTAKPASFGKAELDADDPEGENEMAPDDGPDTTTESDQARKASEEDDEPQVTFTDEQKALIEEIVKGRLSRARKKWDKSQDDVRDQLESELRPRLLSPEQLAEYEALRKAKEDAEERRLRDEKKFDELIQKTRADLEAQIAERDSQIRQIQAEREEATQAAAYGALRQEVLSAARRHNAVHEEDVYLLTRDQFGLDEQWNPTIETDESFIMVDGRPKPVSELTIDEFIGAYLADRPHLVKSSETRGSGSGDQSKGYERAPAEGDEDDDPTGVKEIARGVHDKLWPELDRMRQRNIG